MDGITLVTPYFQHYIIQPNNLYIKTGTFVGTHLDSTQKYIALIREGEVVLGSYNNWSFQGLIPAYLRGLFTPNGKSPNM